DVEKLKDFEARKNVIIYLQPGGLDTVSPLTKEKTAELVYTLPGHGVSFSFLPTDFIQVNGQINNEMVNRALSLLEPEKDDAVLDLFCGLGNFTLQIAMQCRHATGIEGDAGLIERARANADRNRIDNVEFHAANLMDDRLQANFLNRKYNKILLDPPRAGAMEIIERMEFSDTERIVYVSCNPATLARDAGMLVKHKGFRLYQAGVMDMFPHTSHIESIALFTR